MNNKLGKYHYYAIGFTDANIEIDLCGNFRYSKIPTNEDIEPAIIELLQQKADTFNTNIIGHKLLVARGWKKDSEDETQIFNYLRGWSEDK